MECSLISNYLLIVMKILADKYLQNLDSLLPDETDIFRFDPERGLPADILTYDALLIRTVTKVNRDTFPEFGNIKFIGSATAGFDHVEVNYLKNKNIAFARSAGCNANAVGEYVLTVLYRWAYNRREKLHEKKVGIVGFGYTGSAVDNLLHKLDIETVLYDPPKAERNPGFKSAALEELYDCDILTFHTPLTLYDSHPTYHMCNADWLRYHFDLIVNASRGGVVDEKALLEAHETGNVKDFALDVWENEPEFFDATALRAYIHTPHIAGYSTEAKWMASFMVIKEMCRYFEIHCPKNMPDGNMEPETAVTGEIPFSEFLWLNSNIKKYHTEFQKLIGLEPSIKGERFAKLRSNMALRNEFAYMLKQVRDKDRLPEETAVFLT